MALGEHVQVLGIPRIIERLHQLHVARGAHHARPFPAAFPWSGWAGISPAPE
jgi:hypothetical protein